MNAKVRRYFAEHGFTVKTARFYGVVVSGTTIHYRCHDAAGTFFRSRDLAAERKATLQPKRRRLDVCYFFPRPIPRGGTTLLVCEGEPDALAALQARIEPGLRFAVSALLNMRVAFLPGTATPVRKIIDEIRRLQPREVYLAFDGDHAGNAAAERILEATANRSGARMPRRLPIPDGQDLADVLAANRGGDTLGDLIWAAA